jgi:methylated-DNA-protein-cysteine methyltransferase-like protein
LAPGAWQIPVTPHDRPSFFRRVYQVVRLIPPGQVATYGQIAEIVSHRQAARTVGWALNGLPEGEDVPWHRVINARGLISPRGRGNAAATQRALLEREGVLFDPQDRIDLARFQWPGLDWPEIEQLRASWT